MCCCVEAFVFTAAAAAASATRSREERILSLFGLKLFGAAVTRAAGVVNCTARAKYGEGADDVFCTGRTGAVRGRTGDGGAAHAVSGPFGEACPSMDDAA
jgi:hypothetical protein